jgi:hypothetical protein
VEKKLKKVDHYLSSEKILIESEEVENTRKRYSFKL